MIEKIGRGSEGLKRRYVERPADQTHDIPRSAQAPTIRRGKRFVSPHSSP
jgi:hypothetical protein